MGKGEEVESCGNVGGEVGEWREVSCGERQFWMVGEDIADDGRQHVGKVGESVFVVEQQLI